MRKSGRFGICYGIRAAEAGDPPSGDPADSGNAGKGSPAQEGIAPAAVQEKIK